MNSLIKLAQMHIPASAIVFKAIKSSGPGGQNVNKVSTAIEIRFNIYHANLNSWCIQNLLKSNRINSHGELILTEQSERSLEKNKQKCLQKLSFLLNESSKIPKKRKPTRPTLGSVRKRLDSKKKRSSIKAKRNPNNWE